MLYNNSMLQSYGTLARFYKRTGIPSVSSTHSTAPYTIAGPVIVYGTLAAVVYGAVLWLKGLLPV